MGERPRNVLALFLLIALSVAAASPVRAQQKTCYSCHKAAAQKYDLKFKHDPVAKENCEGCHVRHGFSNSLILKNKGKALCTGCHTNFDTSFRRSYSPHDRAVIHTSQVSNQWMLRLARHDGYVLNVF